jgi:two-component system chemotaxis response regulator CheB
VNNDILRVLVVDDSPVARNLLKGILDADPHLQVIAEAKDGVEAVELVSHLKPDVVTMDVQMPRMDGLRAIEEIMVANPTPIVVVSSTITSDDVRKSMDATEAGALTAISKPASPQSSDFVASAKLLVETVKSMATVKVIRRVRRVTRKPVQPVAKNATKREQVLAIAASTGGPQALHRVLDGLPSDFPLPILVVQHICTGFTTGFVSWLQQSVSLTVKIAADGEQLSPGTVYVGPESHHLGTSGFRIHLIDQPPVGGFRPSANELFQSVAHTFGDAAIALILTGMGEDGVKGLQSIHQSGGHTIAQDEDSSVVFGMPRAAFEAGVVDVVLSLDDIARYLVDRVQQEATEN